MRSGLLGKQEATALWSAESKRGADEQQLTMRECLVEIWVLAGAGGSGASHAEIPIFVKRTEERFRLGWVCTHTTNLQPHSEMGQRALPASATHTPAGPCSTSTGTHLAQSIY